MRYIKTRPEEAEKVRRHIRKTGLAAKGHKVLKKGGFLYFPIIGGDSRVGDIVVRNYSEGTTGDMRDAVREFKEKHKSSSKSIELLGNIAVIETSERIAGKLAAAVMEENKGVSTVVMKSSAVKGRYRTRKYRHIAGKRTYVARYRENGCTFVFNLRKSFFSSRLAFERKRVADLSKNGERVVVMFAGVGPFAVEIAKGRPKSKIVAIELNDSAYKYMLENININHVDNIVPVCGDVAEKSKDYLGFADRIVMPLPKGAQDFIGYAISMAKRRCIFHYYAFAEGDDPFSQQMLYLREEAAKRNMRFKLLFRRIVRTYSASVVEIALDFELSLGSGKKQGRVQ